MTNAHAMLNHDVGRIMRSVAAYGILVNLAREAANKGILQGSVETRRSAFQKLDRVIVEGMGPIRTRRDVAVSRSGKTASFEACHVVLMPERADAVMSRQFRLVAIRLLVAHDEIAVEKLPLQAKLRLHSGERMLLRADISSGHLHALAADITDWYYALKIADSVLDVTDQERLTMPGSGTDGLVLGYIDRSAAVPAGELLRFARGQEKAHVVGASPFAPSLFTANTYIGAYNIRDDQQELRDCWMQWRHHFERKYQLGLERELWPFREIAPVQRDHRVGFEAVDAVRAFLLDPRALRTMQNNQSEERRRSPSHTYAQDVDEEVDEAPMRSVG